jgi:selenocysteine lyase/cysteine desulfurase
MITCKHSKFTLPARVTYLNCAYMSPLLKNVEKVGIRSLRIKRNPAKIAPQDFFTNGELLRAEFAKLINVSFPKRVVVIPSVSYGLASVARNLKIGRGEKIIVAAEQFPSNYYPWQSLCQETGAEVKVIAPPTALSRRGEIWNERILDAIDSNTKTVSIGNVHWTDGTLFNLSEMRKRTRDVGALLIIDGTQSVGALPFDVAKIQPDALICAGYKWLLGPYSIGLAYYGEYFDEGRPIEENWLNRLYSEDFDQLVNYQPAYQEGSLRYEVGEHSNFNLVPMMLKAIQQLNRWGVANIQAYCKSINKGALASLEEKGYWIEDENYRSGHLFGIRLLKNDQQKIKTELHKNNIYVSFRGDAIRVSPNVYNDVDDMNKLVKALSL